MVISLDIYKKLLQNPDEVTVGQIGELKSIVDRFPYFQSARALYLKALKSQGSFRYNHELKVTAAHTIDRTVLFEFITSDGFSKDVTSTEEKIDAVTANETRRSNTYINSLQIGEPINFTKNESYSFNEWLQLATHNPIVRAEPKKKSLEDKLELIDRFIKNNPKISPVSKGKTAEFEIPKNKVDKTLMTQTLARVYLEQKKYEKAIKAFEILSLKYPEKSGFFADQIKKIKILKKQ